MTQSPNGSKSGLAYRYVFLFLGNPPLFFQALMFFEVVANFERFAEEAPRPRPEAEVDPNAPTPPEKKRKGNAMSDAMKLAVPAEVEYATCLLTYDRALGQVVYR